MRDDHSDTERLSSPCINIALILNSDHSDYKECSYTPVKYIRHLNPYITLLEPPNPRLLQNPISPQNVFPILFTPCHELPISRFLAFLLPLPLVP